MKPVVTICIPTKTEVFLQKTTEDILAKATGEIEVIVVLNGYTLPENEIVKDERVRYLHYPAKPFNTKRQSINWAVKEAKGDYVMSVDAHCMFAKGFDEQLIKDHNPNWVQVPRRHRLDAENWTLQPQGDTRPPIDYEYIMFAPLIKDHSLHGFKWDERTNAEADIPIAETAEIQASCWFMTKEWFQRMGFMDVEKYSGWGQEAEEICLTTAKFGGYVMTNKNTWYAHLHKGDKYGRMYHLHQRGVRQSYEYVFNYWVVEENEFFIKYIKRFPRMPSWPDNWESQIKSLVKK